ncbi:MAG: YadA-like family protein [Moraxella sp.]
MNKVYRLVWNKATQTWNAVSEYAKSQGKSSNAVIMPSLKGAYRVMRTFMRFAYTALMSALLLLSGRAAIAVTGTTTSSGTSVTNAGSHNTCYYDTTTQSVVCGDASTKVPGVYGAGTSSAPSRISQSVVLGQGAEVADSFSRESSTDTIMHSHAVVIGQTAKANGYQSVAVGANSETSRRSTALGFGAKAGGHNKTTAAPDGELYGVAIGYKADAPRHHSVAIGAEAKVNAIATTDTARSDAILQSNPQNGLIDGATSASDSAGAMALGRGTKANGYAAIAHGLNAEATAAFSTAIGANSKADKMETIALGSRAEATEHHAISIGSSFKQDGATKASGENSIAIGTKAQSATNNTIAIGANSKVSGTTPIAAGSSVMSGISGIAIGSKSEVNNRNYGIAIGEDAFVGTYNETKKIGGLSYYNQDRGDQSDDAGRPGIAIGWKTQSTGDDSLALGNDSIATGRSSVAMGKAAYAEDTDAIAIGNSARAGQPASITPGSKVSNHNSTAIGSYAEAIGGWNTAIGTRSYVNASGALAAGTMASAKGQRATAVGSFSFAEGETSTALGYHTIATETAKSGTAMGTGTVIDGKMSGAWSAAPHANPHQYDNTKRSIVGGEGNYAIGNENIVGNLTKNSVVFGNKIKIGADGATLTSTDSAGRGNSIKTRKEVATYTNATALENAVAIGNSSKVTVSNGVALGSNSVANVDKEEEGSDPLNAVTNKQNSTWKATHAAVSVGDGTDVTRQITSVAAGKNDTDAVNVAQLKAAGFELSVSETGGGSSEDKTQSSNLSDKKVKNGETVTVDAGKNIKVTQTGKTVSIATKDEVEFTKITLGDTTNNTVLTSTDKGLDVGGDKITNVANGVADKDAVNVSQLKAAQAAATSKVAAGNGISVTPVVDATTGSTTYTVAADTTTLNVGDGNNGNPAGKVIAPAAADANKLATAGDIANAINKSGFQATAGGNLASGTNATPTTVKPGQKVTFAAGNGLTVKQEIDNASGNQTYTYALDAQSVVQDAQLPVVYTKADGSKVYKQPDGKFYDAPTGGNEVAAGDVIASMQDAAGSTTAPTTLANVKSNLADVGNAVTNPAGNSRTDLAGKGNNAATVNDVLNSGFTIQGNGTDKDFVTHGDSVNFANGQGTVANVTSTNGVTTVKFDTPMTYADASGNPTSTPSNKVNLVGGDATKPVTLGNVADGTVAAGSKEAVNGGQLHDLKEKGFKIAADNGTPDTVQLTETVKYTGDSNIVTTVKDNEIGFKLADSITVGPATGGNPVKIDGNAGTVTGLTNKTWDPNNITSGRGATEDQLKAAVATTPLTVANGKVTPPAAADANKLATAGDIANAINNSGFQATAGGNLASGSNATPTTVKPGQKVTFAAGNGLTVKQEIDNASGNQTYTYALDAQSVVQDAQLPVVYTKADGSKVYKQPDGKFYDAPTGGNEVAAGDVIASMQDAAGSTTAPTTLANVKSNLADAGNAVTNPAGNSRADLAGKGNNAATVNDVLNSGFTVQGNGQNKDFVTHGDTINFANGQGTVANVTSSNGVTTVKFDTPMTYADASGNPISTPSNKVNLVGGTAGSPVTLGNVADGTVAAGSKEAVNGGQLHATNQNVANNATNIAKGINFGGTTGSNNYQLGDTINVKGDSNITSTTVAGGAQLALNPNLNVTSVTTTDAAGNKTVTSGSGVTITPAAVGSNPVSLTTSGLNNGGNKITNVKAGEDNTDAVNVSQLKAAQAAAKTTATAGKNITVKPTTNPDGSTNYEIATKDDVTFSKTTVGNVVTDGATGKITGLTAGDVSATSTDAVNGSQLHAHGAGVKNIIGGNTTYNPATGNYTNADIGGTGKDNIDAAIKAVKTEVKAGDNIAVTSNVDADGKTTYTVATKKDLVVDSVKAGDKVTLNNAGLTAGNVSVTTGGINAGNTIITNVQSGLNGKTLEQIKADPNATERNNAATIGDLATVQNNVTNINNNYNTVVNKVIGGTTPDGKVTDANGKIVKDNKGKEVNVSDALKTYNVSGNHAKTDNTLITAIKNINEGGIKFFHVNDGTGNQNVTGSDTHAEDSAASGNFAAAVGYQAKASGANAIAFGNGAEAAAKNAISIGTGNKVSGENSGAIGDPSIITGNNSYSVGNNNTISTNNTFVLGNNVTQTVDNSVFLGNNAASTGVHTTANGGNYTYAGMNDAGVSGVSNVVGVVSVGKEGETRQIQNVAAGVVSATSTDAINGSQLYATAEGLAGTTINMGNQLNNRINEVKDDANAGVSSAMAMAALPQAYIPGKSMLTGGMATYNGQGAVAVGLSKLSDNGRWVLKVSGSADTKGNAGGAVGAGFHF